MKDVISSERKILRSFRKGCTDYGLLADGDRILVGLSGGKDSMLLARLLAERSRIFRPRIEVGAVHVVMDNIPYESDCAYLEAYCEELGIAFDVVHSRFDESTDPRKTRCFLCAHYRRRTLFDYAATHGYNKVALGHHQDDILVTALMNMTFEGSVDTMRPKVELKHWPLSIIRPLCLVQEEWIKGCASTIKQQKTPCPYETLTRRHDMENVFRQLESINPEARYSMWHALMKHDHGQINGQVAKINDQVAKVID